MSEPQYKPITGMINVNDIQEIIENNRYYQQEIKRLNNIIIELSEKNKNLLEDNMRLRKEINLHSGKLYLSDIEVKEVWK